MIQVIDGLFHGADVRIRADWHGVAVLKHRWDLAPPTV
jgi:hypothetical protein